MEKKKLKVVYIAGAGRSGSTALCRSLQKEGFGFCGGELRNFWDCGYVPAQLCSCKEPIKNCEIWGSVGEKVCKDLESPGESFAKVKQKVMRKRTLPLLIIPALRTKKFNADLALYKKIMTALLARLSSAVSASWVIDSSKHPTQLVALAENPDIEVTVVHLVRNPLDVANSWKKKVPRPSWSGKDLMPRYSAISSSFRWVLLNRFNYFICKKYNLNNSTILFEDFVLDSPYISSRIKEIFADEGQSGAEMFPEHVPLGNPMRMTQGNFLLDKQKGESESQIGFLGRVFVKLITGSTYRDIKKRAME